MSNNSNFDATAFMSTEIEAAGETEFTPIPEGEYNAVLKEVNPDTTPKGQALLECKWIIDDQEVRDLLAQDEPTCRQTVWLDVADNGALEFGKNKNIGLSRLRDAFGQNTGAPWSPQMLVGQVATVQIKHRLGNEGQTFSEVKGVRAIG